MKTVALSEQTHRSVAPAGLPSGRPGDVGNVSRIGRCFPDHAGQHVDFGVARPDARPLGGDLLFDAAVHVGEGALLGKPAGATDRCVCSLRATVFTGYFLNYAQTDMDGLW